jgi:Family of unknown function (DUF5996)
LPQTNVERWPALPYPAWKDTYATLHMWAQIVGKVALALAPPLNHSWAIALQLTSRGLSTRRLWYGERSFTMEFDFIDHRLIIRASDGGERAVRLEPRTVADFYQEIMAVLREMGLGVKIWTMPVEVQSPIRFEDDTVHGSYDPTFVHRFWQILGQVEVVLTQSRCAFVGKASPTHFFWGGFDLAASRFSGRRAPPRDGPAFMREAYSHEVISHGFWPGGPPVLEPVFYAYAAPEPAGFKDVTVPPEAAFYHREMNEFFLPYESVRTAGSPEAAIRAFVESTYGQAADLAKWDRRALEPHVSGEHR